MTTDRRRRGLLAEVTASAERATELADRYAAAIAQISEALSDANRAGAMRARLVIASLDMPVTTSPTVTGGADDTGLREALTEVVRDWRQHHIACHPDAPTLIYGDGATTLANILAAHPAPPVTVTDAMVERMAAESAKHIDGLGSKPGTLGTDQDDGGLRCSCGEWSMPSSRERNWIRPWTEFHAHVARAALTAALTEGGAE